MKMIAPILIFVSMIAVYAAEARVLGPAKTNAKQLPGNLVQISAKGNELWGRTKLHQILRWNVTEWQTVYGFAHYVSAGADGQAWHLGNGHSYVYRYNLASGVWDKMASILVSSIAAYSAQIALYIRDGKIWQLQADNWQPLVASDTKTSLAAMGDNSEIWRIDENSSVHRYVSGSWQLQDLSNIQANPVYIDVQNENRVVLTDSAFNAWLWNGAVWRQVVEAGVDPGCAQATINNDSVFCLDTNGNIFEYTV